MTKSMKIKRMPLMHNRLVNGIRWLKNYVMLYNIQTHIIRIVRMIVMPLILAYLVQELMLTKESGSFQAHLITTPYQKKKQKERFTFYILSFFFLVILYRIRRGGSRGFVLNDDSLDEGFYVESLNQEQNWLEKYQNKLSMGKSWIHQSFFTSHHITWHCMASPATECYF